MSDVSDLYKTYTSLLSAIHTDLSRWECLYGENPDAIFMSGEARALLWREIMPVPPGTFAVQPVYPVLGPIQPPVREYRETLFGIPVYQYYADGVKYYLAKGGAL